MLIVRWPIAVAAIVVAACGEETPSGGGNKTDRSTVRHAAVPQALVGDWTSTCVDPGTYAYRIQREKLTMKRIREDCEYERPALFVDRTWRARVIPRALPGPE
jgi:hypothetical protein